MRSRIRRHLRFSWPIVITGATACSGAEYPARSDGAGSGEESGAGGGGGDGFVPGGELTTWEATLGPMEVPPGAEETRCVLVRLDNPEALLVRRFRTKLSDGSHHFIVYRSEETVENGSPETCPGFSGFSTGEMTVFIAQHGEVELVFPSEGDKPVGLEIAPRQMLRLEMHWLNSGGTPLEASGTVVIDAIPAREDAIRAGVGFWGTTHLNAGGDPPSNEIPPASKGDTGVLFQPALPGTKTFALTTHQHWRGTRMRVWYAGAPLGTDVLLADVTDWASPPLVHLEPAVDFPGAFAARGARGAGLSYRCEYDNPTPTPVGFGESAATQEMCFLWHYNYPAQGLDYCVDGKCN